MRSSRRWVRPLAMLWAAMQFALPMAVLYADAFDSLGSVGRDQTHVEASASAACRPVHTEECALCRFLTNSGSALPRADVLRFPDREHASCSSSALTVETGPSLGLPASRAPPTV